MTTTTTASLQTTPRTPLGPLKVTQARVLRSEWTKLRSLRSTTWTLLVAAVLMVGLSALFAAVTANQYDRFSAGDKATFDPIVTSLGGISFAQLAIGVLGVLVISGEYSTGMIRASLTVVPRRLPVLWGKLTTFAALVLGVSLVTTFASFLIGQALLSGKGLDVSLGSAGAIRSVVGAALYLTVLGLMSLAIGTLLRSTAAGISTVVGLFFVLPPITQLLPSSWTSHFVQYLPSNAGSSIFGGARMIDNPLSPWTGFAVFCGYAVVLIAAAAWQLRRRDA